MECKILNRVSNFIFNDAISVFVNYLLTFFSIIGEDDKWYDPNVMFTLHHFYVL